MADFLKTTGLSTYQVQKALWKEMNTGISAVDTLDKLVPGGTGLASTTPGGYPWSCGGMDATRTWLGKSEVQEALHISKPGQSGFDYHSSGPASITLHPELSKNLRMLIYNGK